MKKCILLLSLLVFPAYSQDETGPITPKDNASDEQTVTATTETGDSSTAAEEADLKTASEESAPATDTASENSSLSESSQKDTIPAPAEERSDTLVAAEADKTTLAVMDFGGQNVDSTITIPLANRFRSELMKTNKYEVMERTEMRKILEEQNFQRSDCVDQTCAVEAGQLIAVKKIVTGTVAKVGGIYTLNVKVLDVETGRIDQNISEDCDCPIEKVLTETMNRLAYQMAGLEVEKKDTKIIVQRGDASLFVKTDPEDASVYIDGKLMDGRTPGTFENLTPGKHTVQVKKADFQAGQDVELIGNQVVRISLKLEKQKTALKIASKPTEAEIFLDRERTLSKKPDQLTPGIFYDITPGPHKFSLFKVGYIDTTLSITIEKDVSNDFSISLVEETDNKKIMQQKKFVKRRKQRKPGRIMLIGSLGFAAAGAILMYYAQEDYDDAMEIKDKLDLSSIKSGPVFEELVQENKDKNDSGNLKTGLSIGMFGATGVCGGLGFLLFF